MDQRGEKGEGQEMERGTNFDASGLAPKAACAGFRITQSQTGHFEQVQALKLRKAKANNSTDKHVLRSL